MELSTRGGFYFVRRSSPSGLVNIDPKYIPVPIGLANFLELNGVVGFLSVDKKIPADLRLEHEGSPFLEESGFIDIEKGWEGYNPRYVPLREMDSRNRRPLINVPDVGSF